MRRLAIVAALAAWPAGAQVTGDELARQCAQPPGMPGASYCLGFIHAFFDSTHFAASLGDPATQITLWDLGICVSGTATIEDVRQAVIDYRNARPVAGAQRAAIMFYEAMILRFPCQ